MKVVWTEIAKQHLQRIYDHIEPQSEVYARKIIDKLVSRADALGDFPDMGRTVPEYDDPNVRELLVSPHRIIYIVRREQVDVIGLVHTSQNRIL